MSGGAPPGGDLDTSVLICDDNESLRGLLNVVIGTGLGMRVVGEAADGNESIAEAARLQPDVILLDLAMPKLSGLEALPEIRRVAPDSRIVVFSGFASNSVAEQVLALGAASYLEKGADPDAIVASIEQALSRNGNGPLAATPSAGGEILIEDS